MEKFELLDKIENFWDQKREPTPESEFEKFETKKGVKIPTFIKGLYSLSNGGFPEYGYVKNGDKYHSLFFEWIPQVGKFESFKDYVDGFDLDDEDSLDFVKNNSDAIIWHRHGFEFFVLFWPNTDPNICDIGIFDLAAPEGDSSRFTRFRVGSDPVGIFARSIR